MAKSRRFILASITESVQVERFPRVAVARGAIRPVSNKIAEVDIVEGEQFQVRHFMPPPSFKPELIGDRFANHEVPLEVLKDFVAFEELLMEVAKLEYLADHPDHLRIPKGFTKGVEPSVPTWMRQFTWS